jgi:hypothetical protein
MNEADRQIKVALIEPHYLPSLEFFCSILSFDKLVLEVTEHYVKQTYRNRCYINTDKGIQVLTVPIVRPTTKIIMMSARIDSQSNWQNIHWRSIQSAYAKAPFFEHYSDKLKNIIYYEHEFLVDLNAALLSFCLANLKLTIPISETMSYGNNVGKEITDLRNTIIAKNQSESSTFYQPITYLQVFGNAFVKNLSLIDLLFCAGPDSLRILRTSQKIDLNK